MKLTVAFQGLLLMMPIAAQQRAGIDLDAMDKNANPCVDFYQYACGAWNAKHPVPPDQSRWGRFEELIERNQNVLRQILDGASLSTARRDAIDQKIGDYYASCMDEAGIEKQGLAPLKPELDRIAALQDKESLPPALARLHLLGVNAMFRLYSDADYKDASRYIAYAAQGGLSLPDRDYYTKDDARSAELRKQYVAHVTKMFQLMGETAESAARKARAVMDIETTLAKGSLDRVSRRDPEKTYHKMSRSQLTKLAPDFPWQRYFESLATPPFDTLNVAQPDFFRALGQAFRDHGLDEWKTYLTWHVIRENAPLLPSAFVNENFEFFGRTLTGAKELRPRWKRCVSFADNDLGEALGRRFVERTFGTDGKARTLKMVQALESALAKDIQELAWMTAATKKQALEKLHAITNKIGYPDKWRDYSTVKIVRGDAVGNSFRANEFETHRRLAKIGKPFDKSEWGMTPPTVNAYYNPSENDINFPAGILQSPFFDARRDDAVNFGGIGAVIGHELTHGFDDQGRKFDGKGNLRDWWTAEDGREFEKRTQCLAEEYSSFPTADVKVNGKLTLGENTADNGGVRIALMALLATLAGRQETKIDGFTPEQRLFLGWGQIWCQNVTPEAARLRAMTDPHSPGRWRVNGVVSNMLEFQKAFGCTAGQAMVRENACRVW